MLIYGVVNQFTNFVRSYKMPRQAQNQELGSNGSKYTNKNKRKRTQICIIYACIRIFCIT